MEGELAAAAAWAFLCAALAVVFTAGRDRWFWPAFAAGTGLLLLAIATAMLGGPQGYELTLMP
jgi:uncharacterized membrane protein YjjP (DUF1212 family)